MRQIHDVFSNFDKAKDAAVRDFSVFWSDGIDSTTALAALLLQMKPMDWGPNASVPAAPARSTNIRHSLRRMLSTCAVALAMFRGASASGGFCGEISDESG